MPGSLDQNCSSYEGYSMTISFTSDPLIRAYLHRWLAVQHARVTEAKKRLAALAAAAALENRPVDRWLCEALVKGIWPLPEGAAARIVDGLSVPKDTVRRSYEYCSAADACAPPWPAAAKRLKELLQPYVVRQHRPRTPSHSRHLLFPPLAAMREAFCSNTGFQIDWPERS